MKVIDLLNKIANGEEVPEKIKWEDTIYEFPKLNKKELSNITLTNKRDIVDIKDKINEILDYLEGIK